MWGLFAWVGIITFDWRTTLPKTSQTSVTNKSQDTDQSLGQLPIRSVAAIHRVALESTHAHEHSHGRWTHTTSPAIHDHQSFTARFKTLFTHSYRWSSSLNTFVGRNRSRRREKPGFRQNLWIAPILVPRNPVQARRMVRNRENMVNCQLLWNKKAGIPVHFWLQRVDLCDWMLYPQ